MKWQRFIILIALAFVGCKSNPYQDNKIYQIVKGTDPIIDQVLDSADKYKLQIRYTQIDRDSLNQPIFTRHDLGVDLDYFYPASTVKMPTAFLALEKLNELNIPGLTPTSVMLTDSAYSGQSSVRYDSTSETYLPSIGHYIKKIFLVSDNDAYNRLYEFLGQDEINEKLKSKGFGDTRITHRLSIFLTQDENRHTNPIRFYNEDTLVYNQEMRYSEHDYTSDTSILLGEGHIRGEEMVNQPMDFKEKNYMSIPNMQDMLITVMFPEAVPETQQFNLTERDYQFVYQYMSELPPESSYPEYNENDYYPSYVKFFMFGDSKEPIPEHIRIFNKVGDAYGFLIDNAYIVDFENKVEFMLTAVLQVNENQIYNDGNYEYDEIGFPFLSKLGQAIYKYELDRTRQFEPDLSRFRSLEYK